MEFFPNFDQFLNESIKIDLGGAEPLEIKDLKGGISLIQQSKIGKGKNVVVIPKEAIPDLLDQLEFYNFHGRLTEAEMNDPVLVLARAAKDKAAKNSEEYKKRLAKRVYGKKREELENQLDEIYDELKDLYSQRSETFKDQDLEAGEKGDDWSDEDANRYGKILNDIDDQIEKLLKKRNEIEVKLSY
jgi:folate-binding Fe-S cluster repair protein YgfZ